jgi:transposase-like protein
MGKRHTKAEIAAKLDQAQAMAVQGKLHSDIARSLGVSVMTYHRWRKARGANGAAPPAVEARGSDIAMTRGRLNEIGGLRLENSRLRTLVADLLLEKMQLEESLQGRGATQRMSGRG